MKNTNFLVFEARAECYPETLIWKHTKYSSQCFVFTDKQKKLSLVRYGVMASMHPDVKRIAPENLLQKLRLDSTPKDAHLEHLISTRDRLAKSIEEDRRNAGARATSLGDRIDDMEKRLRQTNETIAKRMAVLSSTMGIKDVLQKVRVVCSTVSSAINLKQ